MSRRSSLLLPAIFMVTAATAYAQDSNLPDPRSLGAIQDSKSRDVPQGGKAETVPPSRAGHLDALEGEVALTVDGEQVPAEAERNFPVAGGAEVVTARDSRGVIALGNALVALDGRTDVKAETLDDERVILSIGSGSIDVRVHDLAAGVRFSITTPVFNATLEQPGAYRINVDPSGVMRIDVFDGLARVETRAGWHDFSSGQALEMDGDRVFATQARLALLEDWVERGEARLEASVAARYVSTDIPGYEDLDTAGSWQSNTDYGPVWVPKVAADWAPYQNGHWAWVRPWGWSWIDSAPWGFVPFHYGRWIYAQGHWAWSPGKRLRNPVYLPAVVGFDGIDPARFASPHQPPVRWVALGPGEIYRAPTSRDEDYLRKANMSSVAPETLARARWQTDEWPTFMNIDHVRLGFANAPAIRQVAARPQKRDEDLSNRKPEPTTADAIDDRSDGLDDQGRMVLRLPMDEARRLNLVPGEAGPNTDLPEPYTGQSDALNHLTHPELADRTGLVDPVRDTPARPSIAAAPLAAVAGQEPPLSHPVLAERKKSAAKPQAQAPKHNGAPHAPADAPDPTNGAGK